MNVEDVPDDAIFVDSRSPKAWGESWEQLPGATRMTAEDAAEDRHALPRAETIVVYCT